MSPGTCWRAPVIPTAALALSLEQRLRRCRWQPAAHAIAFTNAGIVIAGLLSMFVFGEREHWPIRLAAMALVAGGLAVLAFSP